MEQKEISRHEVLVFRVLLTESRWLSSKELTTLAGVAPRTARAHALKLTRLGVVDQAEVFPGYRYRLSDHAEQRNRGYVDRLRRAADVLGIELAARRTA